MKDWEVVLVYRTDYPEYKEASNFLFNALMGECIPKFNTEVAGINQEPEIFISPRGDYAKYGFNRKTLEQKKGLNGFKEYCREIRETHAREFKP